jgi:hypothetical protein
MARFIAQSGGLPRIVDAKSVKDEAIKLLRIAAEVEHTLLVEYLYAAFTLGPHAGPKYRRSLVTIAKQEMGHFVTVQNLLRLLGASPHLDRDDLLPASGKHRLTHSTSSRPWQSPRRPNQSLSAQHDAHSIRSEHPSLSESNSTVPIGLQRCGTLAGVPAFRIPNLSVAVVAACAPERLALLHSRGPLVQPGERPLACRIDPVPGRRVRDFRIGSV